MKLHVPATLALAFVLIGATAYAQGSTEAGGMVGANISKVTFSNCRADQEPCNLDFKTGFTGGAYFAIAPASPTYKIEVEGLYTMKGGKELDSGDSVKINYFDVPVIVRVTFPVGKTRGFVTLGPSFSFRMSAEDSTGEDISDDIKSFDLGVVFGGGIMFSKMLGFETRYQQSMQDILTDTGRQNVDVVLNNPYNKVNNRTISFLLTVRLTK